jgi:hypothetical protein
VCSRFDSFLPRIRGFALDTGAGLLLAQTRTDRGVIDQCGAQKHTVVVFGVDLVLLNRRIGMIAGSR